MPPKGAVGKGRGRPPKAGAARGRGAGRAAPTRADLPLSESAPVEHVLQSRQFYLRLIWGMMFTRV